MKNKRELDLDGTVKNTKCSTLSILSSVSFCILANRVAQLHDFVQMWPKSIILWLNTCNCFLLPRLPCRIILHHNICPLTFVSIDLYWHAPKLKVILINQHNPKSIENIICSKCEKSGLTQTENPLILSEYCRRAEMCNTQHLSHIRQTSKY